MIGRRLHELRKAAGLSQTALADMLAVRLGSALTGSAIYKIESGARKMTADELIAVSLFFRVNIAWWVGYEEVDNARDSWARDAALLAQIRALLATPSSDEAAVA